jgi:TRAP-type C4-dicarboxylate transport system substrate-binding protein
VTRALVALTLLSTVAAAAEPRAIKLAAISPDGTLWSRELKTTAQEIEARTDGAVRVKLYLGGVAGDEAEVSRRIAKGQLDAAASAGVLCDQVSPTLRAISIPGLFGTRDEAFLVSQKLRPVMDDEAQQAGFALVGVTTLGQDVLFTQKPVRTLGDLRALKLWRWDGDDVGIATARAMGLSVVPTPVHEAISAMEAGRLDGFMAIPMAALAFQWSTHTRYLTSLRSGHLNGCVVVANRLFDKLTAEQRDVVRAAVAKMAARLEEITRREDEELVGALFARQGVNVSPPSAALRSDFFTAAQKARASLPEAIVPHAVLDRVLKAIEEVHGK